MSTTPDTATTATGLPAPGRWTIDTSHTSVGFWARHLGIAKVRGEFRTFSGEAVIADEPEASSITVTIAADSIDTRDGNRDAHLRSADFLDTDNHPSLTFRTTSVKGSGRTWEVNGDLTIRGTTRPVVLETTFEGVVVDPDGLARALFHASTEIDREDFGLTWNQVLETGGVLVGKRVTIDLDVELIKAD